MSRFLILHNGFVKPLADDMAKWNAWFESVKNRQIDRGHMPNGNEITKDGITSLPFGPDSMTGFTMIEADSLEQATQIASECPIVSSTRVYELKG